VSDPAQPDTTRRATRAALIVFSAATVFASEAGRIFGPDGIDWAKGVGVFLWPSLLVTIATVYRWQPRQRPVAAAAGLPVFRYWSSPRTDEQV
jgi:hypothetical protein